MDSLKKRKKPELVAPAGNLEKLTFAVLYGADAVYFGGDAFNLRIHADNFSHEDIQHALDFCHAGNVRTVFLLNSFLHEKDLPEARECVRSIKGIPFDAIMVADPAMITLIQDEGLQSDIHLSTQSNTLNHMAIRFWQKAGVKRIVLGRETTLEEIRIIKENTDAEIEVFVHGALCVSYSGRCLLSRYFSGRDANQGDCSQPCRWRYSLVEEKRDGHHFDIIEHAHGTEILSSKDLCLVEKLEEYIDAGVDAFKIEGRVKSLYHAANTTRIYRQAIDLAGTPAFAENLPFWLSELDLVSHRPYTTDLFNEFIETGFTGVPYINKAQFTGYREDETGLSDVVRFRGFIPTRAGETLDVIFPIVNGTVRDSVVRIEEIMPGEGHGTDMIRPGEIRTVRLDLPVHNHGIFRRRLDRTGSSHTT